MIRLTAPASGSHTPVYASIVTSSVAAEPVAPADMLSRMGLNAPDEPTPLSDTS